MDDKFHRLKARSEYIISSSTRPNKKVALAALLDVWARLEHEGISAFDFTRAAVLLSEGIVVTYDRLEAVEAFGEHLKERGSSVIRCVRDHWPPVEPDKWPERPPEWLSK